MTHIIVLGDLYIGNNMIVFHLFLLSDGADTKQINVEIIFSLLHSTYSRTSAYLTFT